MPPRFPYGMRNVVAEYNSSISTDLAAYEDLPGHHLVSIRNLIATSPDELYPNSDDPEYTQGLGESEYDYSRLRDPEAFKRFQAAVDYCFAYSDNSSARDYDP